MSEKSSRKKEQSSSSSSSSTSSSSSSSEDEKTIKTKEPPRPIAPSANIKKINLDIGYKIQQEELSDSDDSINGSRLDTKIQNNPSFNSASSVRGRSKSIEKKISHSKQIKVDRSSSSKDRKERSRSRDRKERSRSRDRKRESESRSSSKRALSKSIERSKSKERRKERSRSRDRKKKRSKSKERRKSRSRSRDKKKERSRSRDKKRDRSRSRDKKIRGSSRSKEKRSERSRSKEKRKSRHSSRSPSHHRDRKSPSHSKRRRSKEKSSKRSHTRSRSPLRSRKRSRSRSRSRSFDSFRSKRLYEKKLNKLSILEKLGIELKVPEGQPVGETGGNYSGIAIPSYYNPQGVNPLKYAQQIQKRRLIWGKKPEGETSSEKKEEVQVPAKPPEGPESVWKGTTFSQDQDGKLTAKFKRLMGIKGVDNESSEKNTELIQKQEEMFSSMEKQYEVARVSTHTHRGLGLGFGVHMPR